MIKLFDPSIGKEEEIAIKRVLTSKIWANGAGVGKVSEFENKFRKYTNSKNCIAVNSGTAALNLALSLYNIKDKEVILPSMTFVATANAVIMNGGKPVFIDVYENTLNIDLEHLKSAITDKTKKIRESLLAKRWCGITNRNGVNYDVKQIGNNYYMSEFSAAIGLVQLKKLDTLNNIHRRIAKRYSQEIKLNTKMQFNKNCSYHLYWILVKNRDQFRKKMSECGIETGTHYKPIHTFSLYRSKTKLKNTENIGKSIVSIPCHSNLKESDIDKIVRLTNKFS